MERRHYVLVRRHHDIPIRRREDVPLRRLGDVPLRRHWVFHLGLVWDIVKTYHWDVIGCFIWDLFETSWRRTTETSWWRSTETSLGVSFETYLRRRWNVQNDATTSGCRVGRFYPEFKILYYLPLNYTTCIDYLIHWFLQFTTVHTFRFYEKLLLYYASKTIELMTKRLTN